MSEKKGGKMLSMLPKTREARLKSLEQQIDQLTALASCTTDPKERQAIVVEAKVLTGLMLDLLARKQSADARRSMP